MTRGLPVVVAGVMVAVCAAVSGQELPLTMPEGQVPVQFTISGAPSKNGAFTNLFFEMKNGERVRAIRIFSEPSHTFITAFVDNRDGSPSEAEWYKAYGFKQGARVAQLPLAAGTRLTTQGKRPVPGDTRLAFHIDAVWPGETDFREQVLTVTTDLDKFNFTLQRYTTMGQVCCSGDCGNPCILCNKEDYSCCYKQQGCTWCGEATAHCGLFQCTECR